ncbi:MAG: zinc-ribbon domain-containing protein [Butyricicoccus sp.]|nr:zinc-ribbon domain-containing protein [Butyricicoccus sp.]
MRESLSTFCHRKGAAILLTQWDTSLPQTPENISYGSTQKVWWKCASGHRWQVTVNSRTAGRTHCPYCAGKAAWPGETDLATRYPELATQWHPTKNLPLTPDTVLPGSAKKVWWQCAQGHIWQASIRSRTDGCGCPVCANRTVAAGENDLSTKFPNLAQEWHPTWNGTLTPRDIAFGSKRKVWWRCEKGHTWRASVQSRTRDGTGCPVCAGRVILPGENDMASRFPLIAREWHPVKNGSLLPSQVAPTCKRQVWWLCPRGHAYTAAVGMRTMRNSNCPYCAGKRVLPGFNDLASTHPQIAAQWHPTLNGTLTPQMVTAGSHKKIWWQCGEGHSWNAALYSRTGNPKRGCPVCAGVVRGKRKLRYEQMLAEAQKMKHGGDVLFYPTDRSAFPTLYLDEKEHKAAK